MSKNTNMGKWYSNETNDEVEDEEELEDDEEEEDEEEEDDEEEESHEKKVKKVKFEMKNVILKIKKVEKGVSEELSMKIDKDIELRWLMVHYCREMGLDYLQIKLMFNGARVRETDTPILLNMHDYDVVFVLPNFVNQDLRLRATVCYKTLCVRMHKRRDTFVRLSCTDPLLQQLQRHFSDEKHGKSVVPYFHINGFPLRGDMYMDMLNLDDGDVVDAFDFEDRSSLGVLSTMTRRLRLTVKPGNGKPYSIDANRSTPLTTVVQKYAESIGTEPDRVHLFLFGRRLSLDKTVEEECLYDGCRIDAFINYRLIVSGFSVLGSVLLYSL